MPEKQIPSSMMLKPTPPTGAGQNASLLRTWTRLAVGTFLYGYQTLADRTRLWHDRSQTEQPEKDYPIINHTEAGESTASDAPGNTPRAVDTAIGLVFDAQNRVARVRKTFTRVERLTDRVSSPLLKRLDRSGILKPFNRTLDRLAARGQEQLDYWMDVGRLEGETSRDLFKTASAATLDETIDYLSTNPDVQELVQTQSTSLISEVVEEVRERAVSLNMVVEGWIRKMLGLVPREDLPGPPLEVRRSASLWQNQRSKVL